MLSRVAESLYWMSRYLERAENAARLLDVQLNLNLELSPPAGERRYQDILKALQVGSNEERHLSPTDLTLDASISESISSCVAAARENARQIREQISSEMFEQLNKLYLYVRSRPTQDRFAIEPHSVFRKVKDGAHLFQGLTDSTMTHGQGWLWIQAGRYLERSTVLVGLMQHCLQPLLEHPEADSQHYTELLGLLKSCTAWEAYCKVHGAELTSQSVAEFLILNPYFPHSLFFSFDQMATSLHGLVQVTGKSGDNRLDKITGKVLARLRYTTIEEIVKQSLADFLHQLQGALLEIHGHLYQSYFSQSFARAGN